MSNNLSVEEIIKQAEKIKKDAEYQLKIAQEQVKKRAEKAIDEVVVNPHKTVNKIVENKQEKEKQNQVDEDVKIFDNKSNKTSNSIKSTIEKTAVVKLNNFKKTQVYSSKTQDIKNNNEKTQSVNLNKSNNDITKTQNFDSVSDKTKNIPIVKSDKTVKIFESKKQKKSGENTSTFIINNVNQDKDELQDMPTLFTVKQLDKMSFVNDNYHKPTEDEEIGQQICFDGFDDEIEEVNIIDEDLAEKILIENRKEKIGKFRLFGPDKTDEELNDTKIMASDYRNSNDKNDILHNLIRKKNIAKTQVVITIFIGVILFLITAFKDSPYFPVFLESNNAYFITSLLLFIAVLIINANVVIHGLNLKKSINFDFPISITSLIVLVHTTIMIGNEDLYLNNGVLAVAPITLAILMSQLGKIQMLTRIIANFDFVSDSDSKYTVESITNNVDSKIISRGFLEDNSIIKTSVKTDFTTNFLEISCKNEPADKISKNIFIVTFILNILLFIALSIVEDVYTAFNVVVCSLNISLPIVCLFASNNALVSTSYNLGDYGACVCGFEGAKIANSADAIVMEAEDLFNSKSCDVCKIKTFNGAKVDQSILYTATVIIKTKSPLAQAFNKVIAGQKSILLDVDSVIYEDKMGNSAWIYNKKVLVGNRDLLKRHGVSVPTESYEIANTKRDRKAVYLAVDGKIWAMFVVSYSADPQLKQQLKKLEKYGKTIILKSCDPYINEETVSKLFDVPQGFIRVMNSSSARVYDKYSGLSVEKSPSYVVHNGSAIAFITAMKSACNLVSIKKLLSFVCTFGSIIAFAVIAFLAFIKGFEQINSVNIMIFQCVWSLFVVAITQLKRSGF